MGEARRNQSYGSTRRTWIEGGEERREIHDPRPLHDQDQEEASHKGRHEDDVRQGGQGGSQTSENCRESLLQCEDQKGGVKRRFVIAARPGCGVCVLGLSQASYDDLLLISCRRK